MKRVILLGLLLSLQVTGCAQNLGEVNVGDVIASFSAIDDQNNAWKSSDLKTEFLVVYFYPAAMTSGCTKQACAYRDDKASFDRLNVSVVGVSGDEVKNLKHFKDAYELNFPLLSDTDGKIAKHFGVPVKRGGEITREIGGESLVLTRGVTTSRWTFILDKNGTLIYKDSDVNASDDSNRVEAVIKKYLKGN